ncbi:MAG: hypothetical protein H6850_03180 [Alphaproteobacteria bacterium]|nr:MAG: hypothetical protein H6850_03180 [Alphaproteobacteria bacterium]
MNRFNIASIFLFINTALFYRLICKLYFARILVVRLENNIVFWFWTIHAATKHQMQHTFLSCCSSHLVESRNFCSSSARKSLLGSKYFFVDERNRFSFEAMLREKGTDKPLLKCRTFKPKDSFTFSNHDEISKIVAFYPSEAVQDEDGDLDLFEFSNLLVRKFRQRVQENDPRVPLTLTPADSDEALCFIWLDTPPIVPIPATERDGLAEMLMFVLSAHYQRCYALCVLAIMTQLYAPEIKRLGEKSRSLTPEPVFCKFGPQANGPLQTLYATVHPEKKQVIRMVDSVGMGNLRARPQTYTEEEILKTVVDEEGKERVLLEDGQYTGKSAPRFCFQSDVTEDTHPFELIIDKNGRYIPVFPEPLK